MAVDIPGFSSPAAGPDAPLELLSACHERMGRQCTTLQRLAAHVATHGTDGAAQTAAASVRRYFDTAAVHHHRDEEDDLRSEEHTSELQSLMRISYAVFCLKKKKNKKKKHN